jgi:hypothetical protein
MAKTRLPKDLKKAHEQIALLEQVGEWQLARMTADRASRNHWYEQYQQITQDRDVERIRTDKAEARVRELDDFIKSLVAEHRQLLERMETVGLRSGPK